MVDRRPLSADGATSYSTKTTFSASGKYAAIHGALGYSAGSGGLEWYSVIHIVDVASGGVLSTLENIGGNLNTLLFSKDGERLVTAGNDGTVRLWDWREKREVARYAGTTSPVQNVEMGGGGNIALVLYRDGVATIRDVASDRIIAEVASGGGDIVGGRLHPDEKTVLSWTTDGSLHLGNARTGTRIATFAPTDAGVVSASVAPEQKRIIAFLSSGAVQILDAHDLTPLSLVAAHGEMPSGAAFADDDTLMTWSSMDATVREWDVATGRERRIHDSADTVLSALPHPDGKRLVMSSNDGHISVRDRNTGEETTRYRADKSFSLPRSSMYRQYFPLAGSDGKFVLFLDKFFYAPGVESATIMDMRTGETSPPIVFPKNRANAGFAFLEGGKMLYASLDGETRLWDAATGKPYPAADPRMFSSTGLIRTSDSGRRLLLRGERGNWQVRSGQTGAFIAILKGVHDTPDFKVAGERAWAIADRGDVKLWDMTDGAYLGTIATAFGEDAQAAPSPLGDRVLTWKKDASTATLNSLRDKTVSIPIEGHDAAITGAAFSPDGGRVLTWSQDRTARLWDAATGEEINRFADHRGAVRGGVFSADGARLLTWSSDRIAILWDSASANVLVRLPHEAVVRYAYLTPDSTRALTETVAGHRTLWRIPDGERIAQVGKGSLSSFELLSRPQSLRFDSSGTRFMSENYVADTLRLHDAADASLIREFPRENYRYFASHHASDADRFVVHGPENLQIRDADGSKLAVIERTGVQSRLAPDASFALVWSDTQSYVERWELGDVSRGSPLELTCRMIQHGTRTESFQASEDRCQTPEVLPALQNDPFGAGSD